MIPISNVYYLLAYAFGFISKQGFRRLAQEPFKNGQDLLAALFLQSLRPYWKRGLPSEFVSHKKATSSLQGKLYFEESITQGLLAKQQLVCSQECFESDRLLSQVIKTTLEILLVQEINPEYRKPLHRFFLQLKGTPRLKDHDLRLLSWPLLYQKCSKKEMTLLSLCQLILEGHLQSQKNGRLLLEEILDEKSMAKLYEKFLRGYFQIEHPNLHPSSPQIHWAIQEGLDSLVPRMQTDVVLQKKERILILEAKYYSNLLQKNPFGQKETLHSSHLYQLLAYLENWPLKENQRVDGLLLYAKSDQSPQLDQCYQLKEHTLWVKTLDLNQPFDTISQSLDQIARSFLNEKQREYQKEK